MKARLLIVMMSAAILSVVVHSAQNQSSQKVMDLIKFIMFIENSFLRTV